MDEFGFYGKAFDMNFDGRLNSFERAADFAAFMSLMNEADTPEDDGFDSEDSEC